MIKNKNVNQPKDFGAAMTIFLNDGHDLDEAIKLASEQYPSLYQEYCQSIIDPTEY